MTRPAVLGDRRGASFNRWVASDNGATTACVNKRQLKVAERGVRLLNGRPRQYGESLN